MLMNDQVKVKIELDMIVSEGDDLHKDVYEYLSELIDNDDLDFEVILYKHLN